MCANKSKYHVSFLILGFKEVGIHIRLSLDVHPVYCYRIKSIVSRSNHFAICTDLKGLMGSSVVYRDWHAADTAVGCRLRCLSKKRWQKKGLNTKKKKKQPSIQAIRKQTRSDNI